MPYPHAMSRARANADPAQAFTAVAAAGLSLPGVEAAVKYDGTPVLKVGGCFMAGLATHASAEPGTLVVRMDPADRGALLEEAPAVYYLTGYYEPHPVILVRLANVDPAALRDLLRVSRRLTLQKARPRGAAQR
jgi:hypothetical protein